MLGAVALLIFAAATLPGGFSGRASAGGTTLGIDVDPAGNTASSLGAIQTCRSVSVGDTFFVDLYVTNVDGIQGFDVRFGYNPALFEVVADVVSPTEKYPHIDVNFLVQPDTARELADEGNGVYFIGSGDNSPNSAAGGVLARIELRAIASGIGSLYIPTNLPKAPILHSQGGFIGDTNGDQYFDGPVNGALIAIGQPCGGPTPTPSPVPSVMITPSPPVTPSPIPTFTPTPSPTATVGGSSQTPTPLPTCVNFCQTPSPTPTPTPGGRDIAWGDVDCNGAVGTSDVMYIIRYQAGFAVSPVSVPCPDVGGPVIGTNPLVNWGDVDCLGGFNPGDAIAIMRYLSDIDVGAPETCPRIAENFVIVY